MISKKLVVIWILFLSHRSPVMNILNLHRNIYWKKNISIFFIVILWLNFEIWTNICCTHIQFIYNSSLITFGKIIVTNLFYQLYRKLDGVQEHFEQWPTISHTIFHITFHSHDSVQKKFVTLSRNVILKIILDIVMVYINNY